MAKHTVVLEPGETKQVSFEFTPDVAKTYQVAVNGLSGTFKALEAAPQHDVTIALKNAPANAYNWDMWVCDPNVTTAVSNYDVPVNEEAYFDPVPDSWFPLKYALTVYSAPYVHPGHTTPARDVILAIQSYRQYLFGDDPDPTYRNMLIGYPGKTYYDFAAGIFTR